MWAEYQWNYNLLAMIGKHEIFDWFIRCLKCVLDYWTNDAIFQYRVVVILYLKNNKKTHATKRGIKKNKSQSNLSKLVCSSPISSKSNDLANRANF